MFFCGFGKFSYQKIQLWWGHIISYILQSSYDTKLGMCSSLTTVVCMVVFTKFSLIFPQNCMAIVM